MRKIRPAKGIIVAGVTAIALMAGVIALPNANAAENHQMNTFAGTSFNNEAGTMLIGSVLEAGNIVINGPTTTIHNHVHNRRNMLAIVASCLTAGAVIGGAIVHWYDTRGDGSQARPDHQITKRNLHHHHEFHSVSREAQCGRIFTVSNGVLFDDLEAFGGARRDGVAHVDDAKRMHARLDECIRRGDRAAEAPGTQDEKAHRADDEWTRCFQGH